jgi:hypothetical protein
MTTMPQVPTNTSTSTISAARPRCRRRRPLPLPSFLLSRSLHVDVSRPVGEGRPERCNRQGVCMYVCNRQGVCMYVTGKVRGHVTMTWAVEDCVKLPFFLSVPPLRPGQTLYKIVGITP